MRAEQARAPRRRASTHARSRRPMQPFPRPIPAPTPDPILDAATCTRVPSEEGELEEGVIKSEVVEAGGGPNAVIFPSSPPVPRMPVAPAVENHAVSLAGEQAEIRFRAKWQAQHFPELRLEHNKQN